MNILYDKELNSKGNITQNSIINGNCLEVMKYISDNSIDMVLCDLPFG